MLWDLDDTLYSRVEAARLTFREMIKELLYPGREEAFYIEAADYMIAHVKRNSMIHSDVFAALLEKYPPDIPYNAEACVNFYYRNMPRFAVPSVDAVRILGELRRAGLKTAIVTNIPEARTLDQKIKIEALGISHLFDAIVVSGELGIPKPDRRIFLHAAELLGVKPDECLFVGDDPTSDVMGAIGADMEIVWLDTHEHDGRFDDDARVHRVGTLREYFCN